MASVLDRMVAAIVPALPKGVVRHFSRPYIAGATLPEAVRTVRDLNGEGAMATLDVLGEDIRREEEADRALAQYLEVLGTIAETGIDSNVSVKLTQFGLKLDVGRCFERVNRLVTTAGQHGIFVRLDMEDSSCTDDTLEIHRQLRAKHRNVGVVIQAMLRRSMSDVARLAAEKANVRLCKGIYVEPRARAYQDREIIIRSYTTLLEMLFEAGSYVGIATHDEKLVFEALALIHKHRLTRGQFEFQMLLGVELGLRRILLEQGSRLRVYVPFGERWHAYSVRRLKENPHLAGTVAMAALKRAP